MISFLGTQFPCAFPQSQRSRRSLEPILLQLQNLLPVHHASVILEDETSFTGLDDACAGLAGDIGHVWDGCAVLTEGGGLIARFGTWVSENASTAAFDIALHVEILVAGRLLVSTSWAASQVNTLRDRAPLPLMTVLGRFDGHATLTVLSGGAAAASARGLTRIVATAANGEEDGGVATGGDLALLDLKCTLLQLLMIQSLQIRAPHFQQLVRRTHLDLTPLMLVVPRLHAFAEFGKSHAELDAVVEPAGGVVGPGGEGVIAGTSGVGCWEGRGEGGRGNEKGEDGGD